MMMNNRLSPISDSWNKVNQESDTDLFFFNEKYKVLVSSCILTKDAGFRKEYCLNIEQVGEIADVGTYRKCDAKCKDSTAQYVLEEFGIEGAIEHDWGWYNIRTFTFPVKGTLN